MEEKSWEADPEADPEVDPEAEPESDPEAEAEVDPDAEADPDLNDKNNFDYDLTSSDLSFYVIIVKISKN